ncbi:MAG: hypothetical protein Unbinned3696contig1008_11 [Prokaryotic dsDNA virus sp.]|nr:MAG: hypothetical protein Unbinned3696contig1008_11 [Prokaryotic dsDNA virus sp.]|tara:strand:- start:118 stop:294 length:177 start_codon:yes stop_codon:yes gene_type:complete
MVLHVTDIERIQRYEPGFKTADARRRDRIRKATHEGLLRAVEAAGKSEAWNEGDEANG